MAEEVKIQDPLKAIAEIKKSLDKMFQDFWSNFPKIEEVVGFYEPPYDLEDAGDSFILRIDLPGFTKDEVKIKVSDDTMEINAEYGAEKKEAEKNKNYVVKQRIYKGVHKVISFPLKIRPEEAKARFYDGVLEVVLPKAEATKEREIPIE